jgi:hypothetical protein
MDVKITKLPVVAKALAKTYIEEYGALVENGVKVKFSWGGVNIKVAKTKDSYTASLRGLFEAEIQGETVEAVFEALFLTLFAKARGVDEGQENIYQKMEQKKEQTNHKSYVV